MTNTITTAVRFDVDAFRLWLDSASEPGVEDSATNQEISPYLRAAYQPLDGEAGAIVESTLDMLRSTAEVRHPDAVVPWEYGTGVEQVRVWATADAGEGGADGGLTGEVTVDGVALSLGWISPDRLVRTEHDVLPGYEAAELGLKALAGQVNSTVLAYREKFSGLSRDDIVCALKTLADYHNSCASADLSDRQQAIANWVMGIFLDLGEDAEIIDAEIVDEEPGRYERSAYDLAAEAVDHDPNHPAHPMHW